MTRPAILCLLLAASLLPGSGCSPTASGVRITSHAPDSTDAAFQERSAYIFVNGQQEGLTPATIQIRRSFTSGTTDISLHTGPQFTLLRKFEVEPTVTSSRIMTEFTFGNEDRIFDVTDLAQTKDGAYLIPYYSIPIQVEDREFNLTIIVNN